MTRRRARSQESGFALLLVFLMAAIIAINLYMELPRLAFQAQRQKEQMLMERGEQYKRAIGLFLRTNKNARWPASIEELENYNNRRFLRHRYLDPLTGKDEWRIIHISNGVLTDSVTNKKKDQDQDHIKNGAVMELAGVTGADPNGQTNVNAINRRRPSDGGTQICPDGQPIPAAGASPSGALHSRAAPYLPAASETVFQTRPVFPAPRDRPPSMASPEEPRRSQAPMASPACSAYPRLPPALPAVRRRVTGCWVAAASRSAAERPCKRRFPAHSPVICQGV